MAEINAASAKISDIISTIDEIAFQTNLLAVNAAVEAARAGEEGRGFAVVAAEVRSLAQRSAQAAKEIKGLIQELAAQGRTRLRKLVNKSGETLHGIVSSVKRVTDIVGEPLAANRLPPAEHEAMTPPLHMLYEHDRRRAGILPHPAHPASCVAHHEPARRRGYWRGGGQWATLRLQTVLGSCVSVCLYDPVAQTGGMNHILCRVSRSDCHARRAAECRRWNC